MKIICIGKLKEQYLKDACFEYIKRISKYTDIEIIELKDSNIKKEKEEILKHLNTKDYNIILDIKGELIDSINFSKKIDNILSINPNITFIIGGSDGLDEEIKSKANYLLSFSKMTFPHQLFRVILLEQIYRSFRIINNETYHK